MTIIKNLILWLVVVFLIMFAILQYHAAWADDPCVTDGWAGEIVADVPQGSVVLTDANLMFSAYSDTQYYFSMAPSYARIVIPTAAIVSTAYDVATCSYHVEYDDVVFDDNFEGK